MACSTLASCDETRPPVCGAPAGPASDLLAFHGTREKLGSSRDAHLSPTAVRARFGKLWESEPFARFEDRGRSFAPHAYASPLYVANMDVASGPQDLVIAATSSGEVVAVSAFGNGRACGSRGSFAWRRTLAAPVIAPNLDGGVPIGILSTPVVDRPRSTLYVTTLDAAGWSVFALDIRTGEVRPGFPMRIDARAVESANTNGPAAWQDPREMSQRGALALSPAGDRLYVAFGSFRFASVGWLVAVDTDAARVVAAFSSAPTNESTSNGGIWGAGGPAVSDDGDVWVSTGNSPKTSAGVPRVFGNSVLRFSRELQVKRRYTPFNYCKLDEHNIDLAGSAPLLLPTFGTGETSTPRLLVTGGKQGNVYLLDRDAMSATLDRPPCSDDPATDESLHPPTPQPQFGKPGPLNVFGPYSDELGEIDFAKMRSRPAFVQPPGERPYVFVTGATKASPTSTQNVAPALARLAVVLTPNRPAYLEVDGYARDLVFENPGSPVISQTERGELVIWVVDENAPRSRSLLDPTLPAPVLYGIDGKTMEVVYRSPPGALSVGGKYVTAAIARGTVFVTTDRLQAFGLLDAP